MDAILLQLANYVAALLYQVQQWFQGVFGPLNSWMQALVGNLVNYVNGAIAGMSNTFNSILININNFFVNTFNVMANVINQTIINIGTFVQQIYTRLEGVLTNLITGIQNALQSVLEALANVINTIFDAMADAVVNVINRVSTFISNITATIQAGLQTVISTVSGWVTTAGNAIRDFITGAIQYIQGIYNTVVNAVAHAFDLLVGHVTNVISAVTNTINAAWQQLVLGAEAIINSVNERLVSIRDGFADAATEIITSLGTISEEQLAPMREALKHVSDWFVGLLDAESIGFLQSASNVLASSHTLAVADRAAAYQVFQNIQPRNKMQGFLFHLVFSVGVALNLYSGIARANSDVIVQEFSATYPHTLLPPEEVVSAWRRNALHEAEAVEILKRHGMSVQTSERLLHNSDGVPSVGDLIAMTLRNLIGQPEYVQSMRRHGLDEPWATRMAALAQIIPAPADLISMAVREAFSPDVAARFGQYDDYPEQLTEWAEQQGLSREWALRYWAAHWSLPSATQGFEMLHRGVISRDDLHLLLRALDVMPFWREKLIQTAYHNFTRVDIRRMNALGVLDEQGVYRSHLELGYDESKAQQLTEFVLRLNRYGHTTDDQELGRLSRTAILGFYRDGLLTPARAVQLLMAAGNTAEAATLYVRGEDHDQEMRERRDQIATVIDLATAGVLTIAEAEDRLNAMQLATIEVERALAKLARAAATKAKLPTVDQGTKMFQAHAITEPIFRDLLQRLGYADNWVTAFVLMARGSGGTNANTV